ncbi:MAG: hypothetical protein GY898_08995 [Proteobacteria bacterium]|nr:hypothetical protein [Pseudomonadota bacterium]
MGRLLPFVTLVTLLVGCGGGASLTIHNGTAEALTVEGLSDGSVSVAAGALHQVRGLDTELALSAGSHSVKVPMLSPGGGAIWSIGGTGCFVEGDFTQYYELPPDIPAQAALVGMLPAGETLYVSDSKVFAQPGQRLPKSHGGGAMRALVQVPCDATVSPEIARAWMEMTLADIQPR